MEYLKLTLDIQGCCGRAEACSVAHRALVLALVPGPGIRDGQQGAPRADFNVAYKQTTVRVLEKTLSRSCTPDLAALGCWFFSTPLLPLHRCGLGT